MKAFLFSLTLCLAIVFATAQSVTRSFDSKDFRQMLESKLFVVLMDDKDYDDAIKSAMKNYWKSISYEFVSIKDLKANSALVSDESKSFLMPLLSGVTFDFQPGSAGHSYSVTKSWITIVNGGRKNIERYGDDDAICIAPVSLYGDEGGILQCAYRMDYIIKGISDAIQMVVKHKIRGGAITMPFNTMDAFNRERAKQIKTKTLVINKDMVNVFNKKKVADEADFKAFYKYGYKLVSEKEYLEILKGNSKDYVCLVPALEVNKHILIYDPSTKETVYYGWAMNGLGISPKDIKKLMKVLDEK